MPPPPPGPPAGSARVAPAKGLRCSVGDGDIDGEHRAAGSSQNRAPCSSFVTLITGFAYYPRLADVETTIAPRPTDSDGNKRVVISGEGLSDRAQSSMSSAVGNALQFGARGLDS